MSMCLETAGQLMHSKRPTLTRMAMGSVLPGTALIPGLALQKTEIHDTRELFFLVEHPEWHRLVKIDPQYAAGVRELVVAVNQAAREIGVKKEPASHPTAARAGAAETPLDQLQKLGELRQAGVLTTASSRSRRPGSCEASARADHADGGRSGRQPRDERSRA
jgi:hypothetical protein